MHKNRIYTLVKQFGHRAIWILLFTAMYGVISSTTVFAISEEQQSVNNRNIYYYDVDEGCTSLNQSLDPGAGIDSNGQIYQSGLSAPFILEQWAIHTLKAVAAKKGGNEADYVTKEHVIALVAFALGEGGDINNSSIFNPLNTGLNAPELLAGANVADGRQAFKSFDAGVEGAARTIVGSNQNRLALVLSKPGSTANEFMEALTYYNRYRNNKFWAGASLPPNQDSYYRGRLALVTTVKNDYAGVASIVIGTPAKEQPEGIRDPSKLTFASGGDATTTGSTPSTTGAAECACDTQGSSGSSLSGLQGVLSNVAQQSPGKVMVSVKSLDGSISASYQGGQKFPTRSSYKIYTAYATLRAIEAGKINWNTVIWNGNTVQKTMEQMIVYSNNDAAEALRNNNTIGSPQQVTQMLRNDIGLSNNTVVGSGNASDPRGSNSQSTADDFVQFLYKLEKRELTGVSDEANYQKLLGFMKRATTDGSSQRSGIVAGSQGSVVADKPGWSSGSVDPASNDVGVVYLDSKKYVIAILTDRPYQWDVVKSVATEVYNFMQESGSGSCPSSAQLGDFSSYVKAYAWPDYHPAQFLDRKPAYAEAIAKAKADGQYIGGSVKGVEGIDCGAFVSRLVIDSGFETKYNGSGRDGNTIYQERWLKQNWKPINVRTTGDLQPGDVAINTVHTFLYVGQINGFNDVFASASYSEDGTGGRAPMAGQSDALTGSYNWYRKQ